GRPHRHGPRHRGAGAGPRRQVAWRAPRAPERAQDGDLPVASVSSRIPPIQCLVTFEALARLRSATLAADELCVTPSAVSHRVRQLEEILGAKLFGRSDFSLTTEGS